MTTEVKQQTLLANQPGYFGQGRVWYLKSATGPVAIRCEKRGQGSTNVRNFINVPAGFKFKAEVGDGWDILVIESATNQVIEIIIGDDDVDVANAVTVNGSVVVDPEPSATISTPADVPVAAGGNSVIAANLTRKRIRVGSLSTNAPATPANLRVADSANPRGVELQPGTWETFETTAALTVFNPDASLQTYWTFEES